MVKALQKKLEEIEKRHSTALKERNSALVKLRDATAIAQLAGLRGKEV